MGYRIVLPPTTSANNLNLFRRNRRHYRFWRFRTNAVHTVHTCWSHCCCRRCCRMNSALDERENPWDSDDNVSGRLPASARYTLGHDETDFSVSRTTHARNYTHTFRRFRKTFFFFFFSFTSWLFSNSLNCCQLLYVFSSSQLACRLLTLRSDHRYSRDRSKTFCF